MVYGFYGNFHKRIEHSPLGILQMPLRLLCHYDRSRKGLRAEPCSSIFHWKSALTEACSLSDFVESSSARSVILTWKTLFPSVPLSGLIYFLVASSIFMKLTGFFWQTTFHSLMHSFNQWMYLLHLRTLTLDPA